MSGRVCWQCIGDEVLAAEIRAYGLNAECGFCDNAAPRPTLTIEDIGPRVGAAFREQYQIGPMEPQFSESSDKVWWEQQGEEAATLVGAMLGCTEGVAEAIVEWLAENDDEDPNEGGIPLFDGEQLFELRPGDGESSVAWQRFVVLCQRNSRFIDPTIREILDALFKDMSSFVKTQPGLFENPTGDSPFIEIRPDGELSTLYRSRIVKTEEEATEFARRPGAELGPPPYSSAIPGRMNPAGISVFYGSFSERVCVAECRPRIGGLVAIARFRVRERLRLLDFTAFEKHYLRGSVFDADYRRRADVLEFLKGIGDLIGRPIQPHEEAVEYVPTQVLAEYLRFEHNLDGLVYPSAQVRAVSEDAPAIERRTLSNVVLFHHAARVVGGHSDQNDTRAETLSLDDEPTGSSSPPVQVALINNVTVEYTTSPVLPEETSEPFDPPVNV